MTTTFKKVGPPQLTMKVRVGEALLLTGFLGITGTLLLALLWAPSVSLEAFESPAAQRIFYWHVPAAWAAFIAFGALFVGSAGWLFKRSERMWRLHVAGAEAGLATGLITVWSGCVWGAAEWGTPWDWSDVRLNTFGLLTLLAVYLVLGRASQPDGIETRDTFAGFGLYGFVLVPFTYIATRIWAIRHPGPVVATGEEGSINGDMGLVLLVGAVSFTVLIVGHLLTSMLITNSEQRLLHLQRRMDGGER